jgi:hypothetical protein
MSNKKTELLERLSRPLGGFIYIDLAKKSKRPIPSEAPTANPAPSVQPEGAPGHNYSGMSIEGDFPAVKATKALKPTLP